MDPVKHLHLPRDGNTCYVPTTTFYVKFQSHYQELLLDGHTKLQMKIITTQFLPLKNINQVTNSCKEIGCLMYPHLLR